MHGAVGSEPFQVPLTCKGGTICVANELISHALLAFERGFRGTAPRHRLCPARGLHDDLPLWSTPVGHTPNAGSKEAATARWVLWFNTERTHGSIDDLTPLKLEQLDYAHTAPFERAGKHQPFALRTCRGDSSLFTGDPGHGIKWTTGFAEQSMGFSDWPRGIARSRLCGNSTGALLPLESLVFRDQPTTGCLRERRRSLAELRAPATRPRKGQS